MKAMSTVTCEVCKKCLGFGYVDSKERHSDGSGHPAWAVRCSECQPDNLMETDDRGKPDER